MKRPPALCYTENTKTRSAGVRQLTLWEKAKASVGEKVVLLVDDDGDRCRLEGLLAGVSTDGEECSCTVKYHKKIMSN